MITVGLYGIDGVYNYGCEAIVRGAVHNIKKANPDSRVVYFSRRAEVDKLALGDLNIDVIQISNKPTLYKRAVNKLFRTLKIKWQFSTDDFKKICMNCDTIFSIGGDMYTIPKYLREQNEYNYYNPLVQFGRYALRHKKKFIIYGASIGPFGNYEKAVEYYTSFFLKVDSIICREHRTIAYLKSIGVTDNVHFAPDPAFYVGGVNSEKSKITPSGIGVNLSALSLKEMYGEVNDETIKKFSNLLGQIVRETGKDIKLIPHVFSPINEKDNDEFFLKSVLKYVDDDLAENIKLIKDYKSYLDVKKALRDCEIVIAARMHCAINAMCEGVPSLLLSYSDKSLGMAELVYRNDLYVIPFDQIQNRLIENINDILNNKQNISKYLNKNIKLMLRSSDEGDIKKYVF